jgi:hypothetical protein
MGRKVGEEAVKRLMEITTSKSRNRKWL